MLLPFNIEGSFCGAAASYTKAGSCVGWPTVQNTTHATAEKKKIAMNTRIIAVSMQPFVVSLSIVII
jgi:hypothetical protein